MIKYTRLISLLNSETSPHLPQISISHDQFLLPRAAEKRDFDPFARAALTGRRDDYAQTRVRNFVADFELRRFAWRGTKQRTSSNRLPRRG